MLCVAIWPNLACRNRFCRFTSGTHFAQYTEPVVTVDPHRGQRAFVWGIRGVLATRLPALAAIRRACVSLAGRGLGFLRSPVANDSGSAIGTAIDAQLHFTGNPKIDWNVYSGRHFVTACGAHGLEVQVLVAICPVRRPGVGQRFKSHWLRRWIGGLPNVIPNLLYMMRSVTRRNLLGVSFP